MIVENSLKFLGLYGNIYIVYDKNNKIKQMERGKSHETNRIISPSRVI